jgi:Holliday junction resolvase
MQSYAKGYRAENELQHTLYGKGWAVLRAPKSGRIGIAAPDLVAIRDGKVIVIECKSRAGAFTVEAEQIEQLKEWQRRAGAVAYVGWKVSRKGWFFFALDDVVANGGHLGKKVLAEKGISLEKITG